MDYNPAYGVDFSEPSRDVPFETYEEDVSGYEVVSPQSTLGQSTLGQSTLSLSATDQGHCKPQTATRPSEHNGKEANKVESKNRTVFFCFGVFAVCFLLFLLLVVIGLLSFTLVTNMSLTSQLSEVKEFVSSLASTSAENQGSLKEQLAEVLGYISPEGSFYNPVTSCADITTSTSDYYWIRNRTNPNPAQVFCDFDRNCSCNQTGGAWMRVAKLNMTDPSQQCPEGFLFNTTAALRSCTPNITEFPGCSPLIFDTFGTQYSQVCGRVRAYQSGSTDAFDVVSRNLNEAYVDGISLTHGSSTREHIWTFAAARDETFASCPCTRPDITFKGFIPLFVGQNYFCETGSRDMFKFHQLYIGDPLWDGRECGNDSTCCSFNNPPWFCRELPQSTTDNVEFRVCSTEDVDDEDIALEAFEIFIK